MICSTLVTLVNPNGIRNDYWYNPVTMTYTNAKGESIDATLLVLWDILSAEPKKPKKRSIRFSNCPIPK